MTSWGLLAVQFVGVFVLTFFFCRNAHRRGFRAGYAKGKLDGSRSMLVAWCDEGEVAPATPPSP